MAKKYIADRDLLNERLQHSENPSVSLRHSFKILRKEFSSISTDFWLLCSFFLQKKSPQLICEGERLKASFVAHYLLISNLEEDSFDHCQRGSLIVHIYIYIINFLYLLCIQEARGNQPKYTMLHKSLVAALFSYTLFSFPVRMWTLQPNKIKLKWLQGKFDSHFSSELENWNLDVRSHCSCTKHY